MTKFFEWFNERTQREKILLSIIPFGVAFALYTFLIQPLVEEKKKLEEELNNVGNVTFLLAKRRAIEKEIRNLKISRELEDLSLKDLYKLAEVNDIAILEAEVLTEEGVSISKKGQNFYISKGIPRKGKENKQKKLSGLKGDLNIYQMKVIASKDNLYKFFKAVMENRLVFVSGLYHGCMSERDFIRRKNPLLICETSKGDYKRFLCSREVGTIPEYIITIVNLRVED